MSTASHSHRLAYHNEKQSGHKLNTKTETLALKAFFIFITGMFRTTDT